MKEVIPDEVKETTEKETVSEPAEKLSEAAKKTTTTKQAEKKPKKELNWWWIVVLASGIYVTLQSIDKKIK